MKPEDHSKVENEMRQTTGNKKLIGRREVLNRVGLVALSAATMMVLMKSQPAKAASPAVPATPVKSPETGQEWRRTTRT